MVIKSYYRYNSLQVHIPASKRQGKRNMGLPLFLKDKLLPILVNRTVIFFFLMCLLTLFLYAVGTVQGFIDSTQLSLLRFYIVLGIFLTFASLFGIAIDVRRLIKHKKIRYLVRAGGYMFLTIFGTVTVLAVMVIITLAGGNANPDN